MSEPQSQEQGDQHRVEALADEYLERLLAGETPDRQQFLSAHPEFAELLGPRLELVELMHRIARAQHPAAERTASLAPPAAPAERVLRVKCPHCGNGIQLVEPMSAEVTCSGCGSSFHLEPGATISFHSAALPRSIGRFEVLEQLGRGAFGTVYKARDSELQRIVAVKVPRAGSFATPQEEERFLREARAAAQLSDPGIVPVLEIAHDRGLPYIVSEFIDGLTLADLLTARRPGFRQAAELTAAVADALDCAHRRHIVHRDIKPSNLLIDAAGRPHVTDFGLARRGEAEITVTLDGQILGTPAYMSPEQAAGDQQHVDARSDVYSLGVVLYEMLSGELPFRGNRRMLLHQVLHDEPRPPRSLNDRVPRDLETICLKAMAKTPARRYASAQEMADDLRRFLNGEAVRARRVGRAEKLARWARRNPAVAALSSTVALLLIAVAVSEFVFVVTERRLNSDLSDALQKLEDIQRGTEVRAASAVVDLDLKHCQGGEIEYGVLRLARTLGKLPSHATELRQCVEMNLLAWAQELRPLGPPFQFDGSETLWEISPDGLTVLTGGMDGIARLWDFFTGEVRATLRGHRGKIASAGFSKNGRVAMTVGEDRTVRLWDTINGQFRGATTEHTTFEDRTVRLWDAINGQFRTEHTNGIGFSLLSPDGKRLVTICHEGPTDLSYWRDADFQRGLRNKAQVSLWDTATGKQINVLVGHEGQINSAAISSDSQMVMTGGMDKTARLWSAESGRLLATLKGNTGAVLGVAFSPEDSIVATLDHQGCVRWWDLLSHREIGPPCKYNSIPHVKGFRFIGKNVLAFDGWVDMGDTPGACFILGLESSIEFPPSSTEKFHADSEFVVDSLGRVYDKKSGKRRYTKAERKFSEDLSRFATEGKFIVLDEGLIDLATEKTIGSDVNRYVYVPSRQTFVIARQTFVIEGWRSFFLYVSKPSEPLDTEIAQLFAEVVTCHELDPSGTTRPLKETEWEERRRKLAGLLDEHPAPFLIRRLAADRWYWLRRQEDRATNNEGSLKFLDRLVAVEPTWQNYYRRAKRWFNSDRRVEVAKDYLEAGRLAGEGFWHRDDRLRNLVDELILSATGKPEENQLGLRLAEKRSAAIPEDRGRRVLVAIALYRLGRYDDAKLRLEPLLREQVRAIISQMGRFFLMAPWPAPLLEQQPVPDDTWKAIAFWAMVHQRLGHPDLARAALIDLRRLGDTEGRDQRRVLALKTEDSYLKLLREAETLIEGKPRPSK